MRGGAMSTRATARDRWETVSLDSDAEGSAVRGKEVREIGKLLGRVAARTVHGCVGDERFELRRLQQELMEIIEERVVVWATLILDEREALAASFEEQADRRAPEISRLPSDVARAR